MSVLYLIRQSIVSSFIKASASKEVFPPLKLKLPNIVTNVFEETSLSPYSLVVNTCLKSFSFLSSLPIIIVQANGKELISG